MTDVQLYLAIGLPTIAVLSSLIVSLVQISGVRSELAAFREESRSQLGAFREESRSEFATLREDMREIRADVKLLTGKVYELMSR